MAGRGTRARYRADFDAAKAAAYRDRTSNPFEIGTRSHRLFVKWCRWITTLDYVCGLDGEIA